MTESMKLYKVTLRGMTNSSTGIKYGISYVVAKDLNDAYEKVYTFLYKKDIGFSRERALDKIELIADSYEYNDTGHMLFV